MSRVRIGSPKNSESDRVRVELCWLSFKSVLNYLDTAWVKVERTTSHLEHFLTKKDKIEEFMHDSEVSHHFYRRWWPPGTSSWLTGARHAPFRWLRELPVCMSLSQKRPAVSDFMWRSPLVYRRSDDVSLMRMFAVKERGTSEWIRWGGGQVTVARDVRGTWPDTRVCVYTYRPPATAAGTGRRDMCNSILLFPCRSTMLGTF